jgi:hypothetical protein
VSGTTLFGVLVPEAAGQAPAMPGAYRTGHDLLLPVALSVKPAENLELEKVETWSWQQALTSGWNQGETSRAGGPCEVPPGPIEIRVRRAPGVCRQAAALGFECVNPREWRNQSLLALSLLTGILLLGWMASWLYKYRRRVLRIRSFNAQRRGRDF